MSKHRKYSSKIELNKPSSKAVKHKEELELELVENLIEKYAEIAGTLGYGIHPDIADPINLKMEILNYIPEADDVRSLVSTDFGQGYIIGLIAAVITIKELEVEDDE